MVELPRLLRDFPPVPGLIKVDYSDFLVEEIPLYPTDGVGTHTYFLLEKAGLSTLQAVDDVARLLNVPRHNIGFAGLKDARAVTRQWMSIEHVDPQRVAALMLPRVRILEVARHGNKLRLGHLKANRFVIRVRQTQPQRLAELQPALATLTQRGVPNYFGSQRFGYRGDTWKIGRALEHGAWDEAADLLLGEPTAADVGPTRRARQLYQEGRFADALNTWPRMFHAERRALRALLQSKGNKRRALAAVDQRTRNFYGSAYQSYLFNQVVAARLEAGLDRLWDGDLAWLHLSGAVFRVTAAATEQPRADAFEISPTGPIFGRRMTEPDGRAAEVEGQIRTTEQLSAVPFTGRLLHAAGGRRPLRFQPQQSEIVLGADERGPYLELRFVLPRGCYATALLRELFNLESAAGDEEHTAEEADDAEAGTTG